MQGINEKKVLFDIFVCKTTHRLQKFWRKNRQWVRVLTPEKGVG